MRALRQQTWNWLPAFLEVAESGGIAEASRRLHLTPAAVSRTLRLLEDELGDQLFNRVGRSLVLNSRGAALRDALRSAVSAVDRGLHATLADPFSGSLRVSSLGVLSEYFVVPALIELKKEHTSLVPEHLNLRTAEATDLLSRGEIDLAFYYEERAVDGIVVERVGQTPMSVYCGRGHPLFSKRRITQETVLEYAFSVPQVGDSGKLMDDWPTEIPRRVGMRITLLRSNLEVCRSGALLTVLPDVAAATDLAAGELRRLPMRNLPPIDVFAARPATGIERGAARRLITGVSARISAVNRSLTTRKRRTRRSKTG